MIVQCEQCQTRFKIPDEKVTEKGVKVRCTKCQNTFRVAREPAPALSAPPPAGPPPEQADPFQAFGAAPEPTGEVTRPGAAYYAPGAPAVKSQVQSWGDVDVDIDVDAPQAASVRAPATPGAAGAMMPFDPPTPVPGVASRRQAAPPPPPNPVVPDLDDPFADFMLDAPAAASQPPVAAPPVAAPRPMPPGAFAPPAARAAPPGAFAVGNAGAARPAAVAPGGPPGVFAAEAAPVAPRGPFPPGAVAPPPPGGSPSAAPGRAAMPPGPGAFPAGGPAPSGAAPSRAAMPPAGAPVARMPLASVPARASRPGAAPAASPGLAAAGSTDFAADPLFDFPIDAPAAPDAASLRHAANVAAAPSPSGATAVGPMTPPPGFESEDPFASIDVAAAAPDLSAAPEHTSEATHVGPEPMGDLFDFSGAGASGEEGVAASDTGRAALLGDVPAEAGAEEPGGISLLSDVPAYDDGDPFKITTPRREVVDLASMRSGPAVTVAKPSARIEDVGMPQRRMPGRARKLTGLVLNLAIATVLVVALGALGALYLRDGKVDPSTLSPDRLRTLVMPASRPFVASDVSNGLYETRDGRMLFVVRGEAENRTGAAAAVRVRAALFDGDQRVRSTEGLAGALATPEELHAVTTREAATALRQRMDAASLPVPPGGKVPFLVLFQEFPTDLTGHRLEVTLEPIPSEPTADRTGG
ncbi:zinc-ribbon domain-containing protein [Corallococcus sp. AS-1-6]|uniref:zinc-ribbon domain-containing protein n=1 Tax=Corallococcus sp. AS-1-6 TaxID=2874599 RepID=UPI0027D2378F|nr:zinc-ribbon domain-containing protein [Corallococcus sp. AS-1-6]MBZ4370249.1 zinc-ribbon domain-containing protein [Corallococcus sp. AS-1-6]